MSMPTPIPNSGLGNLFNFIGQSNYNVQLLIVGGLVIITLLIIVYLRKKGK